MSVSVYIHLFDSYSRDVRQDIEYFKFYRMKIIYELQPWIIIVKTVLRIKIHSSDTEFEENLRNILWDMLKLWIMLFIGKMDTFWNQST